MRTTLLKLIDDYKEQKSEIERLKKAFEELEKYIIIESSTLGIIGTEKVIEKIKEVIKSE